MGKVEKIKNSQAVQSIDKDAVEGVSQIGTDLRDRLEFIAKTYEDINGDLKEVPGLIIDNFSVTETIEKQIVKTQLTSGITTEQVGEGTYNFTINLKLISNNFDKKPEDDIRTLKQIVNAETSIEVYSRVFDLCDVSEIVIESAAMVAESTNMIAYTLQAYESKPDLIRIQEEEI